MALRQVNLYVIKHREDNWTFLKPLHFKPQQNSMAHRLFTLPRSPSDLESEEHKGRRVKPVRPRSAHLATRRRASCPLLPLAAPLEESVAAHHFWVRPLPRAG